MLRASIRKPFCFVGCMTWWPGNYLQKGHFYKKVLRKSYPAFSPKLLFLFGWNEKSFTDELKNAVLVKEILSFWWWGYSFGVRKVGRRYKKRYSLEAASCFTLSEFSKRVILSIVVFFQFDMNSRGYASQKSIQLPESWSYLTFHFLIW